MLLAEIRCRCLDDRILSALSGRITCVRNDRLAVLLLILGRKAALCLVELVVLAGLVADAGNDRTGAGTARNRLIHTGLLPLLLHPGLGHAEALGLLLAELLLRGSLVAGVRNNRAGAALGNAAFILRLYETYRLVFLLVLLILKRTLIARKVIHAFVLLCRVKSPVSRIGAEAFFIVGGTPRVYSVMFWIFPQGAEWNLPL